LHLLDQQLDHHQAEARTADTVRGREALERLEQLSALVLREALPFVADGRNQRSPRLVPAVTVSRPPRRLYLQPLLSRLIITC